MNGMSISYDARWFFQGWVPVDDGSVIEISGARYCFIDHVFEARILYDPIRRITYQANADLQVYASPWMEVHLTGHIHEVILAEMATRFTLTR
jgi:hypothetical protein